MQIRRNNSDGALFPLELSQSVSAIGRTSAGVCGREQVEEFAVSV